jgi:hypothetical protein
MTYGSALIIYGLTLIILSILAVPSLVLSKKPEAKGILDKIAPFQGWIGLIFCFWGIYGTIRALVYVELIRYWFIGWLTWLACAVMMTVLGFILGYGMINNLILSNSEEVKKKGEAIHAKLMPVQGEISMGGIVLGVWAIVFYFL